MGRNNTADTTTPTLTIAAGQNGITIFKSAAGVQGQSIVNSTNWGLT